MTVDLYHMHTVAFYEEKNGKNLFCIFQSWRA